MRTLCSAQIEKSVLPIMYSNIIIRVSVGASRSLNTMRGSSTMRPPKRRATSFSCSMKIE